MAEYRLIRDPGRGPNMWRVEESYDQGQTWATIATVHGEDEQQAKIEWINLRANNRRRYS